MLAPQPLSEAMGDEIVHLPETPMVIALGEVFTPAAGGQVDFAFDLGGVTPPPARF